MQTISAKIGLISGLWEWRHLQLAAVDFFLYSCFSFFTHQCNTSNGKYLSGPRLPLGGLPSVLRKGEESGAEGPGVLG
jgi:hypothetical protein